MASNSATETMQQQHIQCKHTTHNLDHQAHARGCMFVLSQMHVAATGQRVHMTGLHVADRNARSCQQRAHFCREFPVSREIPVVREFPWYGNFPRHGKFPYPGNSHGTGISRTTGIPELRELPVSREFPLPRKFPCRGNCRETGIPGKREFPGNGKFP